MWIDVENEKLHAKRHKTLILCNWPKSENILIPLSNCFSKAIRKIYLKGEKKINTYYSQTQTQST